MSMYYCNRCDRRQDSDFTDAIESPDDDNEMICEGCLTDEEIEILESFDALTGRAEWQPLLDAITIKGE